jgi:cysteate synthase
MTPKYRIRCVGGGEIVADSAALACPDSHDSLLRTEYRSKKLEPEPYDGIFRYLAWLPVNRPLLPSGGPVAFECESLSAELSASRLTVSFSGYFPERNAYLTSCSFKELEALPTMQRLEEIGGKIPVIASAGNTGRAFAEVSARLEKPVVIVVPKKAVSRLWTTAPAGNVFLVAVDGDYTDAIELSRTLAAVPGCVPEGGARNVARRDGMGTVMLDAAVTTGRLPDHYFQAVGSGTGGIAAWEAGMRLLEDGRFGTVLPRLHMAQNEPFIPMVSAWRACRREIIPDTDMPDARESVKKVMSDVLTNRNPPYGIRGGLYDALVDTRGEMYAISNRQGAEAQKLVRETVGIDPDPAAAIATAALIEALETGKIRHNDHILLNLTGGGYERVKEDHTLLAINLAAEIRAGETPDRIVTSMKEWIAHYG